jgi:hypothetical protein
LSIPYRLEVPGARELLIEAATNYQGAKGKPAS